jgi:hypothetical protein
MGAKGANFDANVPIRMGYEAEIARVQDLYLDGHKLEAAAALPRDLLERFTLIGPAEKLRHDLEAWRESLATTLLIGGGSRLPGRGRWRSAAGQATVACSVGALRAGTPLGYPSDGMSDG